MAIRNIAKCHGLKMGFSKIAILAELHHAAQQTVCDEHSFVSMLRVLKRSYGTVFTLCYSNINQLTKQQKSMKIKLGCGRGRCFSDKFQTLTETAIFTTIVLSLSNRSSIGVTIMYSQLFHQSSLGAWALHCLTEFMLLYQVLSHSLAKLFSQL